MVCKIYHKTVFLHVYSYMIHPRVLLGPHHRFMPICLGKEKVNTWAWKGQSDPGYKGAKVQYAIFFFAHCEFDYSGKNVKIMIKQLQKGNTSLLPRGALEALDG